MSCNAVAQIGLKVDVETFDAAVRLLGKDNVLKVVTAYAQKKAENGKVNSYVNGFGESVLSLEIENYRYPFEIVVGRSGIEVRGIYSQEKDKIAAEIGKLLARATVLVTGQKIAAALGRKARITEDRTTESGARVISFEA